MAPLSDATSTARKATTKLPMLGAAHETVLQDLHTYVYLTSELACRRRYKPGSLTYVRATLKTLEDAGLVRCLYLGRQAPGGSSRKVFTLSARGLAYLKRAGVATWPRYHAQEQLEVGTLHLRHHLGTVSTLMAFALLCERLPALSVDRLLAERTLRREFRSQVTLPPAQGRPRTSSVWPDGYVEVRCGQRLMPIVLEYDRGTEGRRAWQEKVAALLAYANGPFQAVSGRRSLTVAVLTPHSDKRRRLLSEWTSAAIADPVQADMFRIAYGDPDLLTPEALLLSQRWYPPHDPAPHGLLEAIVESGS